MELGHCKIETHTGATKHPCSLSPVNPQNLVDVCSSMLSLGWNSMTSVWCLLCAGFAAWQCPVLCGAKWLGLIFMCYAWMVKDATWNSLVPLWGGMCTWWFQGNFHQRKVEDSPCIILIHGWCPTRHCKSKALWALQRSVALMFQQICMLHGVTPRDIRYWRESSHWRVWHKWKEQPSASTCTTSRKVWTTWPLEGGSMRAWKESPCPKICRA